MSNNPWTEVERTYTAYIDAVCKEQLANISHMAVRHDDPDGELCKAKRAAWDAARDLKSTSYVEHVQTVGEAVKSGIPCPW